MTFTHGGDGLTSARILALRENAAAPAKGRAPRPADEEERRRAAAICCAACGHRITTDEERMAINGAHDHQCVNPAGYLFHIGCFATAPGCSARGEPTSEFSWFPGYSWNYAHCGACNQHLGWCFQAGVSRFWGLILARLRSSEA